jgi:hypothetical protein
MIGLFEMRFLRINLLVIGICFFLFLSNIRGQSSEKQLSAWAITDIIDGRQTPSGAFRDAVAIDLDSEGNIFIVDRGRHRLVKYDNQRVLVKEIGGFGDGTEQFSEPTDVCARPTLNIYVSDYNNNRVVRFDSNLNFLNEFSTDSDSPYHFEMPLSVGVSGQYDIFILEDLHKRVIKFNRFNQPLAAFGDASDNIGQLLSPRQICLGGESDVYVSDPGRKAVTVFDYLGNFLREVAHPDFEQPGGISCTFQDLLLVADSGSGKVYFFKNGKIFSEIFDPASEDITPVDVCLWQMKGSRKQKLYVLTSKRCFVYEREVPRQ